jgi:outer membrane protein assembly factor BamD
VAFRFSMSKSIIGVVLLFVAVSACSSGKKEKFAYVERPVETLYADATKQLRYKRYDAAVALFEEVERQHPYSAWSRRAMLMKAFAYYQDNSYEEAIQSVDQFIALHPGNKGASYAYYLKAICYYERIRDVGRDQDFTNDAVVALTDVIRRYPDTEYARDARLKLDLTYDHLAGKEMYVGLFYLRENKHISAINRFKTVVEKYQTTSHVPEALHRITEAYLELGIIDEARASAAVLGYNYPGSRWYQDSYKLFKRRGIIIADPSRPHGKSAAAETPPETPDSPASSEDDSRAVSDNLTAPPQDGDNSGP